MGDTKLISIVIPIYNEEAVLETLYQKINEVTAPSRHRFEIIFVNDGSKDNSLGKLVEISSKNGRCKVLDLSRNFGHQIALSAGIDYSTGDAVVLMDADMEDPPTLIEEFIRQWESGYDVVYAVRGKREVGFLRRWSFSLFHRLNKYVTDTEIPPAGIFGLMDKKVAMHMKGLKEHNKYIPGLRAWLGYKQTGIEVDRGKRYDDKPRVSITKLVKLAFDNYVSFSKLPLKAASLVGLVLSICSFAAIIIIVFLKLTRGFQIQGWASTVAIILLLGGIQLLSIGIIGEYIGRVLDEVYDRPLYIVRDTYGFDEK